MLGVIRKLFITRLHKEEEIFVLVFNKNSICITNFVTHISLKVMQIRHDFGFRVILSNNPFLVIIDYGFWVPTLIPPPSLFFSHQPFFLYSRFMKIRWGKKVQSHRRSLVVKKSTMKYILDLNPKFIISNIIPLILV